MMAAIPNKFASAKPIERQPSSGLSILVVGGGIAGLGFAIEAYRKGHDVRIIDRRPNFDDYGRSRRSSLRMEKWEAKCKFQVISLV